MTPHLSRLANLAQTLQIHDEADAWEVQLLIVLYNYSYHI